MRREDDHGTARMVDARLADRAQDQAREATPATRAEHEHVSVSRQSDESPATAPARPDPERAAILWNDGTYTIEVGRPVRLTTSADLNRLLEQAVERRRDGRLTPSVLIELVAEAIGSDTIDVAERLVAARRAARDTDRSVDRSPVRQLSRELPGPETSLR